MSDNTVHPFSWGKINLNETIHIENIPHVTRRAVGEWLEYADPVQSISKLLERNAYIEAHSTVVNLTTVDGKNRNTSVYHPIGFLLIVMESGQPKAQAMKQAVAEFVWHFAGPKQLNRKDVAELRKELRYWVLMTGSATSTFQLDLCMDQIRNICLELGCPVPASQKLYEAPKQPSLALSGGEA